MDTTMEMRAIMALLLPCPPIPVLALNESRGEMVQSSSHDIYGICMDVAARINNIEDNKRRERDQNRLADQLLAEMRTIVQRVGSSVVDYDSAGSQLYHAMCTFTAAYQLSYMPGAIRTSFAFPPIGSVSDTMRARIREWLAGREIVQGRNPVATASDHEWKSVPRLYYECAVLVLEFEDKARIEELLVANEGKIKEIFIDDRGGGKKKEGENGREVLEEEEEEGISKSFLGRLTAVEIGEDDPAHVE